MKRLSAYLRRVADWLHPPPAQSNADHAAAIQREFEESQKLTPEQRIANRVALLPNAIARDAYLLELEKIRIEQEVEAEYGIGDLRGIAAAHERPTAFARKQLRMVKR